MKNILKTIVERKIADVEFERVQKPIYELMESPHFNRPCLSGREALQKEGASGIIAEFKRKSPSKGVIHETAMVKDVVADYQKAGASMVSVLTDAYFFGASPSDFAIARKELSIPLLRKDFMIDPYQIFQSRAMGADVILLIASVMSEKRCRDMALIAHELGMEVLLELHNESELEYVNSHVDMVGINNRNLKDFSVDIRHSRKLARQLPCNLLRVAESGLSDVMTVKSLRDEGFHGFLMGEYFMQSKQPGVACREFIVNLLHKE